MTDDFVLLGKLTDASCRNILAAAILCLQCEEINEGENTLVKDNEDDNQPGTKRVVKDR